MKTSTIVRIWQMLSFPCVKAAPDSVRKIADCAPVKQEQSPSWVWLANANNVQQAQNPPVDHFPYSQAYNAGRSIDSNGLPYRRQCYNNALVPLQGWYGNHPVATEIGGIRNQAADAACRKQGPRSQDDCGSAPPEAIHNLQTPQYGQLHDQRLKNTQDLKGSVVTVDWNSGSTFKHVRHARRSVGTKRSASKPSTGKTTKAKMARYTGDANTGQNSIGGSGLSRNPLDVPPLAPQAAGAPLSASADEDGESMNDDMDAIQECPVQCTPKISTPIAAPLSVPPSKTVYSEYDDAEITTAAAILTNSLSSS